MHVCGCQCTRDSGTLGTGSQTCYVCIDLYVYAYVCKYVNTYEYIHIYIHIITGRLCAGGPKYGVFVSICMFI